MSDTVLVDVIQLAQRVTKGTTPTTVGGRFTSSGINFVKVESIEADGRLVEEKLAHIDEASNGLLSRSSLQEGDILFTIAGTIGRVAIVPRDLLPANTNQAVAIIRPDPRSVNPRFLYFALRDNARIRQANSRVVQSVQANFSLTELGRIKIPLPERDRQDAIVDFLGALDDKIELNRRMNRTLEEIARSIFRSWFVDFDPVRGTATVPDDIRRLFPARLVESPIGPIPEGWAATPLGEQVEVMRGLSYTGASLADEGMPLHNLNSVLEGGGYKFDGIKYYTGEFRERDRVRPGDVIVANTEQGFEHLLIGYPAIVPRLVGEEGLYSHHLYRVRPLKGSLLTRRWLYLLLVGSRMHASVAGYSNGTTVNMLPKEGLTKQRVAVPRVETVARFDDIVGPMFDQQEALVAESQTLADLRDTLLPKLISGEVRLSAGV